MRAARTSIAKNDSTRSKRPKALSLGIRSSPSVISRRRTSSRINSRQAFRYPVVNYRICITNKSRTSRIYYSRPYAARHALPLPLPLDTMSAPLTRQAPKMASEISSTPSLFRTEAKIVGPPSRINAASRFITGNEAPTCGARSVYGISVPHGVLVDVKTHFVDYKQIRLVKPHVSL